mmetsp:Transcript_40726/g.107644  ORF Transcript_40726/g.107644 Transcript_40726/m.107644 type:complete len:86 (+) Transcript_40726:738-995(+)
MRTSTSRPHRSSASTASGSAEGPTTGGTVEWRRRHPLGDGGAARRRHANGLLGPRQAAGSSYGLKLQAPIIHYTRPGILRERPLR